MKKFAGAIVSAMTIWIGAAEWAAAVEQAQPKHPLAQEHPIEFDARALIPPIYWTVPGITEPLQSVRDRLTTDKVTTLKLRPGRYMYMTTTFAFEFTVNLDGVVSYSKLVDRCVGGRGTAKVMVKCAQMGQAAGGG
jgi:hypothetical protein